MPNFCFLADNGLLKYTVGNSYEYSFDSILTVGLNAGVISEADDTSLKISGVAKIFSKGNCGYSLQLTSVKVSNTKESMEKKILNGIQKPIDFILASGELEPQICTDSNDLEYSVNIKRAVISLFQSGTNTENEVDVFGQCPTHTSILKSGGIDTITKVRNLNSCAYREQINSGLISGVVNEKAGITSSLILQANYAKELKIINSVVESVQLTETYKFVGSTKGDSDISAKVFTSIKLKNASGAKSTLPPSGTTVRSIMYQKPETYSSKNINSLKNILNELVNSISDYVKIDSAKKFVEFIRLLRHADVETLLELSAFPHPNKVLARKVFLDGLFRTSTAEAARAILKQFGKFDDKEKLIAALSLNLVKNVDRETLNQAASQLTPSAPSQLYLSVGSLVADFCSKNVCHGVEIEPLIKKFVDGLKSCKANTKKDEDRIVSILKSIANTKTISSNIVFALNECASTGRSNRIRVSALQAIASIGCDMNLQSKSLELLRDYNEDSEIRIEAYLAAISCPNADLANQISEIVNSEKVYQVGGFISSNLKAIRDSTDSSREQQKYHLSNIRVNKQFPKDIRRYSFNNEISYNIDALGFGASSDYKLIYSQHGFLPRSSRINVTTELFGTHFNIFEASIRQENLENVLEYYLGPKGLLNKDFDEIVKLIEVGNAGGGRAKRSIADDAAKISKKYKNYGNKISRDINLDLSLKLFGSELAFLSFGENIPNTLDDIINYFSDSFEKGKKELSAFEKNFAYHNLFLDTDLTYPTSIGIPLEFTAQGFAVTKLDCAVSLDINAILEQNWQKANYRLKMVPSVDLIVNLQVGFNAQVLSTGLRIVSTAHSASGNDVHFALSNDGAGFNFDVELPREKIEFINIKVNAELFIAEQDKQKTMGLKSTQKNQNGHPNEMCFNQLDIIGLNICIEASTNLNEIQANIGNNGKGLSTRDHFHLSKPFSFAIYLTSERKIGIKGTRKIKPSGSQQWKLDFSTPESKVSHDNSITFELGSKPRIYGRLSFDNSQYHLGVEAGLNNDNHELVAYGQYEQDKEVKKSKIGFTKNGNEYTPLLEIQGSNGITNHIYGYHADGKIIVNKISEKLERYNFENFKVSNGNKEYFVLNGWTEIGASSVNSDLKISSEQQSYLVQGNFKLENGQYAGGLFVSEERSPENVYGSSVQLTINDHSYDVKLNAKAFAWAVDSDVSFEFVNDMDSVRKGTFRQSTYVQNRNKPIGAFTTQSNFDVNKFSLDTELSYDQKVGSLNIKYESNENSWKMYDLEIIAKLKDHSINIISKKNFNGSLYTIDNVLTSSWGTSFSAKGEIGQRYTAQDIHINMEGNFQLSGKDKYNHWIFKIIGTPDKTNGELRVSRDTTELVKFTSESYHPQDKTSSAKVSLNIKNILNSKGEFRVAKNGKGELTATIETQKTEPKHKLDVETKFHILAPKYDIDTSIIIDGNKIHFKSENNLEKLRFSTKNVAEANDKKISFDANGSVKGELRSNGEILGTFSLIIPDGRIIGGAINRKIVTNVKTGITQGNVEFQFTDKPSEKSKRTIEFKGTLERLNTKTKEFSVISQFVYTPFDGKKSELNYQIKHLRNGEAGSLDISCAAHGNPFNQPINISVAISEYSVNSAECRLSTVYGDILTVTLNGNYDKKQAPATYQIQTKVQVPTSNIKFIEFNSHGKILKPSTFYKNDPSTIEFAADFKTGQGIFGRINTNLKGTSQEGNYNLETQTNNMESPFKLQGNYLRDQKGSLKDGDLNSKQKYAVSTQYGTQFLKTNVEVSYGAAAAEVVYKLDSSYESAKDIEVNLRGQKSSDDSTYLILAKIKQFDKSYGLDTKLFQTPHKKGFDIRIDLIKESPIIISSIIELLGERKGKLTLELQNIIDFDFKIRSEASYVSIDDFYIVSEWSSKKLLLNGYELDARAQSKHLKVQLKNASKLIFLGSATYALKKEQNKAIIEGQGQVQYQGKSQNGNFKLTRQHYDITADKEIGFSYTFNGNFGSKNGISTIKITNKEFNTKFSICEEKKQCTNVQLQSIVTVDEQNLNTAQYSTLVLVDLRELGYPYEFELKSQNIQQGIKYQYKLDSFISGNNVKYQISALIQPTSSIFKITLPKRQISLETVQKFPTDGKIIGHYEQSAALYINKLQRPNEVFRIGTILDVSGIDRVALNANGIFKLEHPSIRPLSISARVDANAEQEQIFNSEIIFDVFRLPEHKVIGSSKVRNSRTKNNFNFETFSTFKSNGLQFQYELNGNGAVNTEAHEFNISLELNNGKDNLKAISFGSMEKIELSLSEANDQIFRIFVEFNKQKKSAKYNAKLEAFDRNIIEIRSEIQPSSAIVTLKRQDLLDGSVEVKLGKEFKFDISSKGKVLSNGRVALDPTNFLQTNYQANDENVKTFWDNIESEFKQETDHMTKSVSHKFEVIRNEAAEKIKLVKEASPDFPQLKNTLEENVNALVHELEEDPSIEKIFFEIRTLLKNVGNTIDKVTNTISEAYENINKSLFNVYEKLNTLWKDSILKVWDDITLTANKVINQIRIEIFNACKNAFQGLRNVMDKYGPVLKNYGKVISELIKPINEALQEIIQNLVQTVEEVNNDFKKFVGKLPNFESICNEVNTKIKNFKILEKTLDLTNSIFEQLNILHQTQETTEFLQKLHEYLDAKLKKQSVDDQKSLNELGKLFIQAVRSIYMSIKNTSSDTFVHATDFQVWINSIPQSLESVFKLPTILLLQSSTLNYILNENWENIFSKNWLSSWIFFNNFELKGHIVDGQHVFTFDGQHFDFLGNCKYILAQDSVNNNFSIVAQITNGKLKAITLTDGDGKFAEIADSGALKINGNSVEYPQHFSGIHAWRRYYTIHLHSEYGVSLTCTTDLKVCHIKVNGYYTSKTRGLFGNGNFEPYDDNLRIDGTITTGSADLANEYGIGKCTAVAATNNQGDNHLRSEICSELFGIESPLFIHFLTIDSRPFRKACDISVGKVSEKDIEETACTFALAYGSAVKLVNKWVILPSRCIKCNGPPGQRELRDEFTVKLPNNKADVVFVVDINVSPLLLSNLIAPAISDLRETLKARGFTDVQIGVIVFDEKKRYPALLTSENGKLNYKGNLSGINLNTPNNFCDSCVERIIQEQRILNVYNSFKDILNNIIPQSDEKAFSLALDYPFRAGAAKSIVGVRSDSLEYKNLSKFARAQLTGSLTKFDGALLHLIGPVKALAVEGIPGEKIIGFNSRLVATLDSKDVKKRAKLHFENDMGIDFVLNNGGWIFSTQNFDKFKVSDQKKMLSQITSSIADTLFKTEIISDCQCLPVHGLHGQHKCINKSTTFLPNKKPKA
ncbi:hypothetical protein KR026_004353 [Drosophila bipectinata]|nr:hypothetical protein KR026_004353 [Drosophila bipectinata]